MGRRLNPLKRPVLLSEPLAAIVGKSRAPRTVVTKKLWAHIKRTRGAQEGRTIHPSKSDKLRAVFGGRSMNMLTMAKKVQKHMVPFRHR